MFDERQKYSRPLVGKLWTFLGGLWHVLPPSGLGRDVTDAARLWAVFTIFLDQLDGPIHTHDVGRAIRGTGLWQKKARRLSKIRF